MSGASKKGFAPVTKRSQVASWVEAQKLIWDRQILPRSGSGQKQTIRHAPSYVSFGPESGYLSV